MKSLSRTLPLLVVFLATLSLLNAAPKKSDPSSFLSLSKLSMFKFSPDGSYVAALSMNAGGRHDLLVRPVLGAEVMSVRFVDSSVEGGNKFKNILDYAWSDDRRIIVQADWNNGKGAVGVVDVSEENPKIKVTLNSRKYAIVDPLLGSSKFLISEIPVYGKLGSCDVVEYDLDDELAKNVVFETQSKVFQAMTDRAGKLRLLKRDNNGKGPVAWYTRSTDTEEWKKSNLKTDLKIYGFNFKDDSVWVGGFLGSKSPAIHKFSLAEDKKVMELASHPQYSVSDYGEMLFSSKLKSGVGLHLDFETPISNWMHPTFVKYQTEVNKLFSDSMNRIIAWSDDLSKLIVRCEFAEKPPHVFLINYEQPKVELLTVDGKAVKKGEAASVDLVTFNNEGVSIKAILTKPRNVSKPPLIVVVREKPWASMDRHIWSPEDQYLAARGFAVLRVNVRGSGGHLGRHWVGWKNVEDAMKPIRDIKTAIDWVGSNSNVDTSRIGIIGFGGAGGWLATQASVSLPKTFKAVACYNGVYDIESYWEHPKLRWKGDLPFAAGKRMEKDEQLKLSPAHTTEKLSASYFFAYQERDVGMYSDHVNGFIKNAKKRGAKIEKPFVPVWWSSVLSEKESKAYYDKVATFFDKKL